ncbi:MAG TPA: hypothetical protein VHK06_08355, partial [Candidatus Limnocylindria bacterium]|nr:hypothetical protein [Candidatus Limnocylindria bacterium]
CSRTREAVAARSEEPEAVPDLVVALPAVVFRSYAKVWMRGGIGMFGLVALLAFSGATDLDWLVFTGVVCAGLVVFGVLAGEVSDGMRSREPWAFGLGLAMSLVAAFGSVVAFQAFAPGVVNPVAVRWGSVLVFGGAAVAAAAGLVLLFTHRRRAAARP